MYNILQNIGTEIKIIEIIEICSVLGTAPAAVI